MDFFSYLMGLRKGQAEGGGGLASNERIVRVFDRADFDINTYMEIDNPDPVISTPNKYIKISDIPLSASELSGHALLCAMKLNSGDFSYQRVDIEEEYVATSDELPGLVAVGASGTAAFLFSFADGAGALMGVPDGVYFVESFSANTIYLIPPA